MKIDVEAKWDVLLVDSSRHNPNETHEQEKKQSFGR